MAWPLAIKSVHMAIDSWSYGSGIQTGGQDRLALEVWTVAIGFTPGGHWHMSSDSIPWTLEAWSCSPLDYDHCPLTLGSWPLPFALW
jgi:hypothetical protein